MNQDYLNSCQSCWWKEGTRCYEGDPVRSEDGRSIKLAITKCEMYKNKREMLGSLIPTDKLIITSER